MISIACLSGPYADRVRSFEGTRSIETDESMEPSQLFAGFLQHGWDWSVEYSLGTEEEVFIWFRAELVARIVRALSAGRPVRFLDRVWQVKEGDDPQQVAQDLEDAIVASNRLITIGSDDERGLVIGEKGWEH